MASMTRSQAQRKANTATVRTGKLHTVSTRRGLFGTKRTVTNTHRIANPVQRRNAISGR